MEAAALVDISIAEFWKLTPFELNIAIKGYTKRKEIESRERICQAYLTAGWIRAKKLPNIDRILKIKKKAMTKEELYKQGLQIVKMFGGEVK